MDPDRLDFAFFKINLFVVNDFPIILILATHTLSFLAIVKIRHNVR